MHRNVDMFAGTALKYVPTLQESIGWEYNAILTGVSFRVKNGVWTCIIKADFGSTAMVAFIDVGSFARCVEVSCEFAAKGHLTWHKDKYPAQTRTYRKAE